MSNWLGWCCALVARPHDNGYMPHWRMWLLRALVLRLHGNGPNDIFAWCAQCGPLSGDTVAILVKISSKSTEVLVNIMMPEMVHPFWKKKSKLLNANICPNTQYEAHPRCFP
jgi:hypothetical protein